MSLEQSYNTFMYLQCNFNLFICEEIFGDLSEHLFEKWLNCNENILNFLSKLDSENRQKIYKWLKINYNKISI
jgi:hypothetical protein